MDLATVCQRQAKRDGPGVDDLILWYEGSGTAAADQQFLHADERGSIVSMTDNAGGTVNINSYDDWGIPAWDPQLGDLNIGRFQYTGQIWLEEIGLYYYKARMYSPTLGRFMQTHPMSVRSHPVNAAMPP